QPVISGSPSSWPPRRCASEPWDDPPPWDTDWLALLEPCRESPLPLLVPPLVSLWLSEPQTTVMSPPQFGSAGVAAAAWTIGWGAAVTKVAVRPAPAAPATTATTADTPRRARWERRPPSSLETLISRPPWRAPDGGAGRPRVGHLDPRLRARGATPLHQHHHLDRPLRLERGAHQPARHPRLPRLRRGGGAGARRRRLRPAGGRRQRQRPGRRRVRLGVDQRGAAARAGGGHQDGQGERDLRGHRRRPPRAARPEGDRRRRPARLGGGVPRL